MYVSFQALPGDLQTAALPITNRYANSCGVYWNKMMQVYMVMGNAFSHCKSSSAFSSWEAVSPIKVIIWNEEPLMGFDMCLWEQSHIYT
jgi:hypothetical protein